MCIPFPSSILSKERLSLKKIWMYIATCNYGVNGFPSGGFFCLFVSHQFYFYKKIPIIFIIPAKNTIKILILTKNLTSSIRVESICIQDMHFVSDIMA